MTLSENKIALVAAHRSGDWETARLLSQARQKLKQVRRCQICGVRLSSSKLIKEKERCRMHEGRKLSMNEAK